MDHQRSRIVVPNSDDAGDAGDATAVDVVLVSDDLAGIVLDFVVVAIFTHQHTHKLTHLSAFCGVCLLLPRRNCVARLSGWLCAIGAQTRPNQRTTR